MLLVRYSVPAPLLRILLCSSVAAVASSSLTACGASARQLRTEQVAHDTELAELRAEARHERNRRQDLEKELALRKAKRVRDEERTAVRERPDLPVTTLPTPARSSALADDRTVPSRREIQVRAPKALASEYDLPDDYEIMGLDSEGYEIVYVGEATSDKVVKISAKDLDESYGAAARFQQGGSRDDDGYDYKDEPMRPSLRSARTSAAARAPLPIPRAGAVLPVTRHVPTIDTQLRQARGSTLPSRPRSFGDPRAEYKRYYQALRAGNHAFAVTGFRNFVQRFPHHDFADNAQYWLGEAFYDQKRFKSALVEFRKVVDEHPDGNKVPDALLKLGYCYQQLGESDKARLVWQQILRVYPKSNPASLAHTKLAEL